MKKVKTWKKWSRRNEVAEKYCFSIFLIYEKSKNMRRWSRRKVLLFYTFNIWKIQKFDEMGSVKAKSQGADLFLTFFLRLHFFKFLLFSSWKKEEMQEIRPRFFCDFIFFKFLLFSESKTIEMQDFSATSFFSSLVIFNVLLITARKSETKMCPIGRGAIGVTP